MNGLALLIPIALGLGLAALGAFFWTVRSGQLDDLDGAALRILIDDDDAGPPPAPAHSPE
ncbi:MAG: cbb3-type cytochrome oxidase assembly protein CcoS [Sphingomonas sp.]|jgi:cbb3-type cytochrome oxidase maturation protein|uniref:cbb3-type cytochrome oxidase assembly protein CcoS n=1 Tax=Sphingomonas sp. TaxID=28214 RepID=UPI003561E396